MSGIVEIEDVDDMDFPLPTAPVAPVPPQPPAGIRPGQGASGQPTVSDRTRFKRWVCLYPLYFDRALTLDKGRKVPLSLAVDAPHARQVSAAAQAAGFNVCLEIDKTHPRDFFRPGRVRVQLKDDAGRAVRPDVCTRKQLMQRVAQRLPAVSVAPDREPTLEDLIAQGALPALPGMPPGGMLDTNDDGGSSPQASTSAKPAKAAKKAGKSKKKGKSKTIV
ncbi:signal recognition particle subunit [Coemansia sp. RSA 2708]|nr:signal recognition particle subunit [Coemansia sp. RSA 2708]